VNVEGSPLVSIALCTFNGERFLPLQLESLLSQTFSNLEIVAVDDYSTDNTYDILKEFAKKDNRIKVYRNDINLGFNKNFEKALSLANGAYIAICDQDDIWYPAKIETLINSIGNNWLIFSNSFFMDEFENKIPGSLLTGFYAEGLSYKKALLQNVITGHSILLARELLDHCLPLPRQGYYDWYIGFIALYHKKATYTEEPLADYRIHSESVIQREAGLVKSEQSRRLERHKIIVTQLTNFLNYKGIRERDSEFIREFLAVYKSNKSGFSFSFFKFVFKHYKDLFIYRKERSLLSRANFVYKFVRKGY